MSAVKPMVKSLFAENVTLVTLQKSIQVEKDFCKLKDKQMGDLQLKLQKVGATAVQEFKDSNKYLDELCGYYGEGFDLLRKWMTKHHPELDLSGLVIGDVKMELMFDHPSKATAENVMEEAIIVAEVTEEAMPITPTNPTNEQ